MTKKDRYAFLDFVSPQKVLEQDLSKCGFLTGGTRVPANNADTMAYSAFAVKYSRG